MIAEKKFCSLKDISKQKKIANELKELRKAIIKKERVSFENLYLYYHYLVDNNLLFFLQCPLKKILTEKNERVLLENIHFLYHDIMEKIGYPISESNFIQTRGDDNSNAKSKTELILILENLRSAFNVGSIIRIADCFGIKKIYASGLTPDNNHQKVLKTSKGSTPFIDFESKTIDEIISELKKMDYQIVAVETAKNSILLNNFEFQKKTALIFGNEELGITQKTLEKVDKTVEIEMRGFKNSLNVSNAAAVVVSHYTTQLYQ